MTERVFFFKRALTIPPLIVPVTGLTTYTPVPANPAALANAGVTAFKLINPSPYWVWLRGVNGQTGGTATPVKEAGHYIAPGAVDICMTQLPAFIGAVADIEPGVPAANTGGVLSIPARVILIYGSGNA